MFGGIIPSSRVKSAMSAKDETGRSYSVTSTVANAEGGTAGFKRALAVAGGKGTETYAEGAVKLSDKADVFPSEAEKVVDFIVSVAVTTKAAEPPKVTFALAPKGRRNRSTLPDVETNGAAVG